MPNKPHLDQERITFHFPSLEKHEATSLESLLAARGRYNHSVHSQRRGGCLASFLLSIEASSANRYFPRVPGRQWAGSRATPRGSLGPATSVREAPGLRAQLGAGPGFAGWVAGESYGDGFWPRPPS